VDFRVHDLRHRFALDFLRKDPALIYRLSQIPRPLIGQAD
jgi:hypothetical protein